MKKYFLLLCVLTLFACEKKNEPDVFRTVKTETPANNLSPLVIRFDTPVGAAWMRNIDVAVSRASTSERVGVTYSFSNDKRELAVRPADTLNGWSRDNTYIYTIILFNGEGGKIMESGSFAVGDKPKGDLAALSVRYDVETRRLSWQRLPEADEYDVYVKEKDRSDYVLLASVEDGEEGLSTTQTFNIIRHLSKASKPKGLYSVKVIGRNAVKKGDLAAAAETEVDYNNVFLPLEGLRYNPETYILVWDQPAVYVTHYFIYAKKEGEKDYVNVSSFFSKYSRIDIIAELKGLGFGTYNVKILAYNKHEDLMGDLGKATPVTVEYPDVTPPPMTVLSVANRAVTWKTNSPKYHYIRFYVKKQGDPDSAYTVTTVYDYSPEDTQFSIHADYVIRESYGFSAPKGTYVFKATANDIKHGWYGSLEKAAPVTYLYEGSGKR